MIKRKSPPIGIAEGDNWKMGGWRRPSLPSLWPLRGRLTPDMVPGIIAEYK